MIFCLEYWQTSNRENSNESQTASESICFKYTNESMNRETSLENVEILYCICQSFHSEFPFARGGVSLANLQSMTTREHFHFPYGKALETSKTLSQDIVKSW